MKIPIYQIDAFSRTTFGGNPAAVCPLPAWIDDAKMQMIAAENNLANTAFLVVSGDRVRIAGYAAPYLEGTIEI
jgi:PhzF family phenazine biosynthesis protein